MVSWVNSNYAPFGSGITVPGYGFILHNRGALFSLDPKIPNVIAPHKRPFNTLSAGFVMKDGNPLMTITLMGGDMQAQGHAQALVNIFDLGANLQLATDMARFHHALRGSTRPTRKRSTSRPSVSADATRWIFANRRNVIVRSARQRESPKPFVASMARVSVTSFLICSAPMRNAISRSSFLPRKGCPC
jgi:gamma-glutamyltranspeptidase